MGKPPKTETYDIWDNPDELVWEAYNRDNIVVKDYGNSDRCYIFCASNDLFYPDEREVFRKVIIEKDRFEWSRISSSDQIVKNAGRVILIRDIFKQWYVTGINSRINTMDKLIEHLRKLCKGYKVVTVGSSAGGYAAAVIAAMLNGEICIDLAGQNTLASVRSDFYRCHIGGARNHPRIMMLRNF